MFFHVPQQQVVVDTKWQTPAFCVIFKNLLSFLSLLSPVLRCSWVSQVVLMEKNLPANAGDVWVGKMPWRRAWQPTPVLLSGESDGQRHLEGSRP